MRNEDTYLAPSSSSSSSSSSRMLARREPDCRAQAPGQPSGQVMPGQLRSDCIRSGEMKISYVMKENRTNYQMIRLFFINARRTFSRRSKGNIIPPCSHFSQSSALSSTYAFVFLLFLFGGLQRLVRLEVLILTEVTCEKERLVFSIGL